MNKSTILILIFFSTSLFAQNRGVGLDLINQQSKKYNCGSTSPNDLVINGDFEEYSALPTSTTQLNLACNWMDNANLASPDYLHRNAPSSSTANISIPNNFWGNQDVNPNQGGDAYAGMWVQKNNDGSQYTEIIKTRLKNPLQSNTLYTISFDVSLADNYDRNSIIFQAFLGDDFSILGPGELPIANDPNGILLNNTTFSRNTDGWDTITLDFLTGNVAGQEYLYIGGISNITYEFPNSNYFPDSQTYYYVDNVSLIQASCDWLKSNGSVNGNGQEEIGVSVVVDANNDVLMLGSSLPNSIIEGTVIPGTTYLAKYDPAGCPIWAKDISFIGRPVDMDIYNNDELIVLSKDNIGYNYANSNYYLNRLDGLGNLIWTINLSYSNPSLSGVDTVKMNLKKSTEEIFLLTTVNSTLNVWHTGGNLILQNNTPGSDNTEAKASIIKINPNGTVGWSQTIFGLTDVRGYSISISENSNELFFLGAGRSHNAHPSRFNVYFHNNNTGNQNIISMSPNNHSSYSSFTDFITKFNSNNGNFISSNQYPDWRSDYTTKIKYNHNSNQLFVFDALFHIDNHISIVGNNLSTINDFLFPFTTYSTTVNGIYLYTAGIKNSKFLVSKINSSGIIWYKQPLNSWSRSKDVAINDNKIFITGDFINNLNLNGLTEINHIGGYDAFLTRLTDDGNSAIFSKITSKYNDLNEDIELLKSKIKIYPNPTSNILNIEFNKPNIDVDYVFISDINGIVVYESRNKKSISINHLPKGFYFVHVINNQGQRYIKRLLLN